MWSHKGSEDLILLPNDSQALWQAQKCHPTPLLTHCQYDHAGGCCRQQNVPHGISRLSHVLSLNLLSAVRSIGCQCRSCQTLCFLANDKRPAWCWAASSIPTCGRWTLKPSDHLSRQMHICGLFEVILQGSSCSSLHKGGGSSHAAGLLPSYGLLHIQVAPPCSGHYINRHSKPSCHSSH